MSVRSKTPRLHDLIARIWMLVYASCVHVLVCVYVYVCMFVYVYMCVHVFVARMYVRLQMKLK